jgi:hypothetical protein
MREIKNLCHEKRVDALSTFWFACDINDASLAKHALGTRGWRWSPNSPKAGGKPDHTVWDAAGWPLVRWRKAQSTDFIFALQRAFDEVGDTDELPEKFAEWLVVAKASK